jgi:2'-5' RNA ligase
MPDSKHIRLFVAIELPPSVLAVLSATMHALRVGGADAGLRWVRPEGIHLTLKFMGETDEEDLPGIIAALRDVAHLHPPIQIATGDLGSFGGRRNLRVLWVGVGGDVEALAALASAIDAALAPLGFKSEARAYSPHLTLARVRDDVSHEDRARLHDIIGGTAAVECEPFRGTTFSLMESKLQLGGAVYRQVATFPLEAR